MSILYDSNINSSLELKSSIELITERIIDNSNELDNYQIDMNLLEDIFEEESENIEFNSRNYRFINYKIISNYEFNSVLSNIFQNIKAEGLDCFNFVKNINNYCNNYIKSTYSKKNIIDLNVLMINPLDNFFVSFYKSSSDFKKYEHDNKFYIQKAYRNHAVYSYIRSSHSSLQKYSVYGLDALLFDSEGKQNYINQKENSSNLYPHMTATMINSPYIRSSLQNELEMHTFLNSYSTLEFSKCIPYLDVKMKMTRYDEKYESRYRSNANIKSFLFPDDISIPDSVITNDFTSKKRNEYSSIDLEEIHIGTFSMPQTAVNLNTEIYGRSENAKSPYTLSPIVPHDLTRPFMSIKKLDLDVQAAGGLLAYKSGTLTLTLHDRTRMRQVAAFLDASLQGAYGPRVGIEFGWSHPSEKGNKLGEFLNSAKTKETYAITNSNFSLDNDGSVNIDLYIAQISGRVFTNIKFTTDPEIVNNIQKTNRIISELIGLLGIEIDKIGTVENLSMFKFEYSNFNQKSYTKLFSLFEKISTQLSIISTGSNTEASNKIVELLIGYIPTPENAVQINFDLFVRKFTELNEHVTATYKAKTLESKNSAISLFKRICPNIDNFDPFWDRVLWQYLSNDDKLKSTLGSQKEYMTFGSLISGLIATHLPGEQQFSDIQLYSYTCNDSCGYMSNRNIFSILIKKSKVIEKISKIYEYSTDITLESFITDIYVELVRTEKNISWGISNVYENLENATEENKGKQNKDFKKNVDIRLFEIKKALGREIIDYKIELRIPELAYVFNSSENKEKTKLIYKMSFYDKKDNPYKSILDISNNLKTKKIKSAIISQQLANSSIKTNFLGAAKIISQAYNTNGIKLNYDDLNEAVKRQLKNQQESFKTLLFTEESLEGNSTKLVLKKEYNYDNIKENIKYNLPSITYGTENTAVLSASLSTMNTSGLREVKIAEMGRRRDKDYREERILSNLPLKIFPTAATVEMIGCPFVNFYQDLFLDFQTGTIADNTYKVTGIKQTLTPGSFKTSLTLTPHDAYGVYETHIKGIESLINSDFSNIDIEKEIKLDEEDKKIKVKKQQATQAETTTAATTTATTTVESKSAKGENCLATAVKRYKKLATNDPKLKSRKTLGSVKYANIAWKDYKKIVDDAAKKYSIDASLIWAVMAGETGFGAVGIEKENKAQARGLMQFVRSTARMYGMTVTDNLSVDERTDPKKIIPAAAKYLSDLSKNETLLASTKKNFSYDKIQVETVLSAYNAGPYKTNLGLNGKVYFKSQPHERKRSKGARLYAFDKTLTHYIDPILTFKKLLDECLAEKEKQPENEDTSVPTPLLPVENNEDDDPKVNSTRNEKVRPKITMGVPIIKTKKSRIIKPKSSKTDSKTIKNIHLFTDEFDFQKLAVVSFLVPQLKLNEQELKEFKSSLREDNYTSTIDILSNLVEKIPHNLYAALMRNMHKIIEIYNSYTEYFNNDLDIKYNFNGKNFITTFMPQDINEDSLTTDEKNLFANNTVLEHSDGNNSMLYTLDNYIQDFFSDTNVKNMYDNIINSNSGQEQEINEIIFMLFSYFVNWNFAYRLDMLLESLYDKVEESSILAIESNFLKNIEILKNYRSSLYDDIISKKEFKLIKNSLTKRYNNVDLNTSILIKKITDYEIKQNIQNTENIKALISFTRYFLDSVKDFDSIVTANIIIPDESFTEYPQKRHKRYFNGKGILLDLNIIYTENSKTKNKDFNIITIPDIRTMSFKVIEEDDKYSEIVINVIKKINKSFKDELDDKSKITSISLFRSIQTNKLYIYVGAGKNLNPYENMSTNQKDEKYKAEIEYFKAYSN